MLFSRWGVQPSTHPSVFRGGPKIELEDLPIAAEPFPDYRENYKDKQRLKRADVHAQHNITGKPWEKA